MKILYYSPHPALHLQSPAGYGTHMREMIAAFEELGHEVLPVIMGGTEKQNLPAAPSQPSRLKQIAKRILPKYLWESLKDYQLLQFDKYAKQTLKKAVETFQPDVIYERCAYLQKSGVELAKEQKIPHLLEVNSPYVEEQHNLNGSASFFTSKSISIEKFQLLTTGKVLVISTALQDYFIKKYNVEPSRFAMIPNAINAKHLSIREKQVAALREKLGYEGKQVVGFVGSLFPWHGVDILVHAFAAIYPTFPNTRLLIVGSGEILDDIKALVSHYHLEEVVIFTGSIPHEAVFEYLPLMDITVMATSNWYGSPVKIFEYGALGKAIIAPNNIPVRDVMVHQEDGILVEPNKESLVAALEYFLQYPNERIRIGQCFKDKVLSQFQWIHHAERIISISKSLHS